MFINERSLILLLEKAIRDKEWSGKVVLNGKEISKSSYYGGNNENHYTIFDKKHCDMIRKYTFLDLKNTNATELCISGNLDFLPEVMYLLNGDIRIIICSNKIEIQFDFQFDTEIWKNSYSIKEVSLELKKLFNSMEEIDFSFEDEEVLSNGIHIRKTIKFWEHTIGEAEQNYLNFISDCYNKTHNKLVTKENNSCLFEFEFDENIKIACKQYLEYFIQFLKDLGVNAYSNINEKAGKILFEVVPNDKDKALYNIQQCLMTYLSLVDNAEVEAYDNYNNIAYTQLKANVTHLKSQLMLAQATIEQKQVTINLLNCINAKIKENSDIVEKDNEIDLLKGVITVGEVDCKAFKLNLGKLLKLLFRRND